MEVARNELALRRALRHVSSMRDFQTLSRSAVYGTECMAATSHPLATLAAVDILKRGGNAVDAALAASAVLCVAEPQMTGIGGDCFVIYAPAGKPLVALNGSGRAPAAADLDWYRDRGFEAIPELSAHAVTVPGAVDAWFRLLQDHGTMEMAALLDPAIRLAEGGCPVAPRVAFDFSEAWPRLAGDPAAAALFTRQGGPLGAGDIMRQPLLAATLRHLGRAGRDGFYAGAVADDMVERLRASGGLHTLDDFATQRSVYEDPISIAYADHEVFECPPNGQGMIALMILKVLAGYDMSAATPEADRIHLLAEASKAAYRARDAYLGDPRHGPVDVARFLSDAYARSVRDRIDMARASAPVVWDDPEHKDTVYLAVVDRDGNAISFINSLFALFGSGLMAPRSGVLFHSRGSVFRTEPGHPNAIAPGKRPMHTIIPAMLVKDGQPAMPFGVMGGHFQAIGHAHVVSRMLADGLDPQEVADLPRSFAAEGLLEVETTIQQDVVDDLAARGHRTVRSTGPIGGFQAIRIDRARGLLIGGSDPRKDGCALGW